MIPREDICIGNLTHVGRERTENQDYYGYYEPEDPREFDLKGRLVVVCDGMGGHAGGEIASRLAVNTILNDYRQDTTGNILESLERAIKNANRMVFERGQQDQRLHGMGSTCTSMVLKQGMAYFGHVGDSRCYLLRNGELKQQTKDHSLVQKMVDEGLLRADEMEQHQDKNVILRALGVKPNVDVDLSYCPIQPGDQFMLCSDGLSGLVEEPAIRQIMLQHQDSPMEACNQLVNLANQNGGYDNITVQIVKILKVEGDNVETHETSTTTFSMEEVQKSIEKARAEQGKGARGAADAAEAGGKGGGGGIILLLLLPVLLIGGLVGGIFLSRLSSEAAGKMREAKAKALAAGADVHAKSAWEAAVGLETQAYDGLAPLAASDFDAATTKFTEAMEASEKNRKEEREFQYEQIRPGDNEVAPAGRALLDEADELSKSGDFEGAVGRLIEALLIRESAPATEHDLEHAFGLYLESIAELRERAVAAGVAEQELGSIDEKLAGARETLEAGRFRSAMNEAADAREALLGLLGSRD